MEPLTWDLCRQKIDSWCEEVEGHITRAAREIQKYRTTGENIEELYRILKELNYRVMILGDYQAKFQRLKLWTEKRYEIEKGLETVRITKEEKKAVNYATNAKYIKVQDYLGIMVDAAAMHMKAQNARGSSRDATEAIRSRISQIKDSIRSSG